VHPFFSILAIDPAHHKVKNNDSKFIDIVLFFAGVKGINFPLNCIVRMMIVND